MYLVKLTVIMFCVEKALVIWLVLLGGRTRLCFGVSLFYLRALLVLFGHIYWL